ncbi:hypothetical protein HMPREF9440_01874 [Sutterella parvirubra YIT 11816]|uniref:Uncharacterized protein n=1 Tax=Sutterella parvirubra YIT 11816 TaxID=762967 RepID=H3KGJ5_9BURK|nr:hypothetical protein HMPREF9440_01874 [Sutterella parvirubra YIT 11816]
MLQHHGISIEDGPAEAARTGPPLLGKSVRRREKKCALRGRSPRIFGR